MSQITLLHSTNGLPLTKLFCLEDGGFSQVHLRIPRLFDVKEAEVQNLTDLSGLLFELESDAATCVIRGALKPNVKSGNDQERVLRNIQRRLNGVGAAFEARPCPWICIDIDDLPIPSQFENFNDFPDQLAEYAANYLPPEFHGIDFYWQYSASMGIKEGIRIHLWYWLDGPISDQEAKVWVTKSNVDPSLYSPIQLHFTAAPIFEPQDADPVTSRSGIFECGHGQTEVPVPEQLKDLVNEFEVSARKRPRNIGASGQIDDDRIVRDENGLVVDGREQFMFRKSVEASRQITAGKKLPRDIPDVEDLTNLTWQLFEQEADISDGVWTIQRAREKAAARLRDMEEGLSWPLRTVPLFE